MGTPEFAVTILAKILEENYNVVGVITAPDKPAGRGRKIQYSAVKTFALEKDLPILQPTNLKDETFVVQLKALNANLQVVVAFRMLPEVVWRMPEYGTFNLHASLLPQYRGAAPINWAIINGETKTGVTTFFIDDKIDTGAMILQRETSITEEDTAGTLHDKLMYEGANLVAETLALISADKVTTYLQDDSTITRNAYKIHRETCMVDWTKPLDEIYNHIRGLSPYPAAWTTLVTNGDELQLKLYKTSKEYTDTNLKPGTVITAKKSVKIAAVNGYLVLEEVQLPGKKRMDIVSVLNGFSFSEDAFVK